MIIKIIHLDKIDSTNRYALERFAEFADNTLIVADEQSAGRGRRGKEWFSPAGMNLYASYVVKELKIPAGRVLWCAGLASLVTLSEYAPSMDLWLKWPNDIYCTVAGKPNRFCKIAGLLAETWTPHGSNRVEGVVAGIGINLNMPDEMLELIDQPAVSLFSETGKRVDIAEFAETLHAALMKFRILAEEEPDKFFEVWRRSNGVIGHGISVRKDDGSIISGVVADVDRDGAVLIKESEKIHTVLSGDVIKIEI